VDANGLPIPYVRVEATGISYTGSSRPVLTNSEGRACIEIMRGGTAQVVASRDGKSMSASARVTGTASPAASAAVHAGAIPLSGGIVRVTLAPAQSSYKDSSQNGVRTNSWGNWLGSMTFSAWTPPLDCQ
jgi:hypothetical protein